MGGEFIGDGNAVRTSGDSSYSSWIANVQLTRQIRFTLTALRSAGVTLSGSVAVEMYSLIVLKAAQITASNKSRTCAEIDLQMEIGSKRILKERYNIGKCASQVSEVRTYTNDVVENPWAVAVQVNVVNNRKRAKFQEFDILETIIFSGGGSKSDGRGSDFSSDQNFSSFLFCSSFFKLEKSKKRRRDQPLSQGRRQTSKAEHPNSQELSQWKDENEGQIDTTTSWMSQYPPKPLSLKGKCPNLMLDGYDSKETAAANKNVSCYTNSVHSDQSEFSGKANIYSGNAVHKWRAANGHGFSTQRARSSVTDRMLSSTHTLRCITITPSRMLTHPFTSSITTHNICGPLGLGIDMGHVRSEQLSWQCDVTSLGRSLICMLRPHFKDLSKVGEEDYYPDQIEGTVTLTMPFFFSP
jgi:hypothetical protein